MIQTNVKYLKQDQFSGNLQKAVDYLVKNYDEITKQEVGKYPVDSDFFYLVQEYETKADTKWESHKKYIDIQIVASGEEKLEVSLIDYMDTGDYVEEKDFVPHTGAALVTMTMRSGDAAIFFPEDVHKPGLQSGKVEKVKKINKKKKQQLSFEMF